MNLTARVVVVIALVAGTALFLMALRADTPTPAGVEGEAPTAGGDTASNVPAGPAAKPGVLDSHETCKPCHEEIYAEWMEDRHSQAWVGALYTELSLNHTDANCWSCHAPRPILETGLDSPAETRANYREEGITCLTCHQRGNHVVGSIEDPEDTAEVTADCGPVYDPIHASERSQEATIKYCGVCHNLHGTDKEFLGSKYAREGMTCLTCHMKEVVSPVAKGGKPRVRRVHHFHGAHSEHMLREAMTIEATTDGKTVVARVVNRGAGHKIPTDARHRAIRLRLAFVDKYGQPVPFSWEGAAPQRENTIDLIRLFYRQEQREPTQIDPPGTLGKDNWRETVVEIPEAAVGGRAVLKLYYFLAHSYPLHKATLVEQKEIALDAG